MAPNMTYDQPDCDSHVAAPATLYPGKVMHARLKPFGHRFTYCVFTILIDLDQLDSAASLSRLFSVNGSNLVSFHEADHIEKDSGFKTLRAQIDALCERAGVPPPHKVRLLAYPRVMGFVFNPLSVYFCEDETGAPMCLVYEVRNTFGERHTYVCAVETDDISDAGIRQERTKIFYVSPFIDMGARYHFRVALPNETVRLRILETEAGEPLLSAAFSGKAAPLSTRTLLAQTIRLPFMTIKVVAGIHWEALKLWIKGANFHSRGTPPPTVSTRDAVKSAR